MVMTEEHDRGRDATHPGEVPPRGWWDIALRVKDEIGEDHQVLAAAGVAFFGFLAVIPGLAALLTVAGIVLEPDRITDQLDQLLQGLPSEARDLLVSQLESMAGRSGQSLTLGLVVSLGLALWSASGGMGHLIEAINVAYDESNDRNFFVKKLLALLFTLGAVAFGVFAVVGLTAWPAILDGLALPDLARQVLSWVFWPILVAGFVAGLAVLYRVAPDRSAPRWQWVPLGSVVATVVWLAASIGFRIYANRFGSYEESYGSLAAVVILMLWLFLTAFVVLLGAQINAEVEHQTIRDTTEGGDQPIGQRGAVVADTIGETADEVDEDHDDGDGHRPMGPPERAEDAAQVGDVTESAAERRVP